MVVRTWHHMAALRGGDGCMIGPRDMGGRPCPLGHTTHQDEGELGMNRAAQSAIDTLVRPLLALEDDDAYDAALVDLAFTRDGQRVLADERLVEDALDALDVAVIDAQV